MTGCNWRAFPTAGLAWGNAQVALLMRVRIPSRPPFFQAAFVRTEKQPENHKPRKPAMSQKNRHRNFPPPLFPAVLRTDDALLRLVARTADDGAEAKQHHAALRRVVREQNGYLADDQAYYPADAVELCAERGENAAAFAFCHLLMIQSAVAQTCPFTLGRYWRYYQTKRPRLPDRLQTELDYAYAIARERGLVDESW